MPIQSKEEQQDNIIASHLAKLVEKVAHLEYGPPVDLTPAAYRAVLERLSQFREQSLCMNFWYVVNMQHHTIDAMGGLEDHFGKKIGTLLDFFKQIHPDYLSPYFQWAAGCYELFSKIKDNIKPMQSSVRVSVPLKNRHGVYYWYSQHVTVLQQDAKGFALNYLNTYYVEGKWSSLTQKPFETYLQLHNEPDTESEKKLYAIIAPYIIDEFTNSELEIITQYAHGRSATSVAEQIGWSRHTLNEYNSSILKKARRLFQYNFRTAKEFSLFCLEKEFIYKR